MDAIELINNSNELKDSVRIVSQFDPVFWSLIAFNLIIFALVRTVNKGYISAIFSAAVYNRNIANNIRDNIDLRKPSSLLLTLTYFNAFAIIIYDVIPPINSNFILLIAIALLIGFIIKVFLIFTTIKISQTREGVIEHIYNHIIFYQATGIILTILLIFTHYVTNEYSSIVNLTLLIIISAALLLREIQSFTRGIQANISVFYIILYLCTLEILPLGVIFRIAI
ncbi:DUF4271 domain-containing protein [Crocinitomix catalasitica]|uniref:DUF4271 domain-containing protein n=1 Tax=Crocinitomix catalasitica TaxID=184607 RepID=UPI000486B94C|nr:DUF4271 domain-containing protein [Crocinitomix catalasitica]